MKYLLTSAGIKNRSIHNALLDLLGKPIADCSALCIPTAGYGHPLSGPDRAWNFISGKEPRCPMCELGWKSLGVLELTALPSIDKKRWVGWVRQADVLLVNGGDAVYLLSLIHISEPTRLLSTSYAAFCLKKKKPQRHPRFGFARLTMHCSYYQG